MTNKPIVDKTILDEWDKLTGEDRAKLKQVLTSLFRERYPTCSDVVICVRAACVTNPGLRSIVIGSFDGKTLRAENQSEIDQIEIDKKFFLSVVDEGTKLAKEFIPSLE